MQKHVLQMQLRHFVPPAFVLFLFAGLLLGAVNTWALRLWLLVLLAYVLATLVATVVTVRRTGWHRPELLPVAFVILHLSYGSGFLVGLVTFARGRRPTPVVAGADPGVAP